MAEETQVDRFILVRRGALATLVDCDSYAGSEEEPYRQARFPILLMSTECCQYECDDSITIPGYYTGPIRGGDGGSFWNGPINYS